MKKNLLNFSIIILNVLFLFSAILFLVLCFTGKDYTENNIGVSSTATISSSLCENMSMADNVVTITSITACSTYDSGAQSFIMFLSHRYVAYKTFGFVLTYHNYGSPEVYTFTNIELNGDQYLKISTNTGSNLYYIDPNLNAPFGIYFDGSSRVITVSSLSSNANAEVTNRLWNSKKVEYAPTREGRAYNDKVTIEFPVLTKEYNITNLDVNFTTKNIWESYVQKQFLNDSQKIDESYKDGYDKGYILGYESGSNDFGSAIFSKNGLFSSVDKILSIKLFPGFSIGTFLIIPLGLGAITFILKLARG